MREPNARSLKTGCKPGPMISCEHLKFTQPPSYSTLVGRLALIFHEKLSSCQNKRTRDVKTFVNFHVRNVFKNTSDIPPHKRLGNHWFKRIDQLMSILTA